MSSNARGVLKAAGQSNDVAQDAAVPAGEGREHKSGITWDEVTIAEHDKDRGTRTRITEPKTPFRPDKRVGSSSVDSASDDEASHASSTPPRAEIAVAPKATFPSALAERWDDLAGDGAAHDEWERFTASSASPHSAGGARRIYDGDGDETMGKNFVYDSGSEPGTRPSSSCSEGSRGSRRKQSAMGDHSASHSTLHARFAEGGTTAMSITAPSVPEKTGSGLSQQDFEKRRKAHYSHEFDKTKGVSLKSLLAASSMEDDDDGDSSNVAMTAGESGPARPLPSQLGSSRPYSVVGSAGHTPFRVTSSSGPFVAATGAFSTSATSPFGVGGGFAVRQSSSNSDSAMQVE